MTNFESSVRILRSSRTIEISKTFDKAASRFCTPEYEAMQQVRKDYPSFNIVAKTIRNKADRFKGQTYDFMEKYIKDHDDDYGSLLAKFNDLRATSDEAKAFGAEALSYGEIKAWFFQQYPEFAEFQKKREELLSRTAA